MLFWHCDRAAAARTFWTAGTSRPMRMAMMAITTSNSIRVKPRRPGMGVLRDRGLADAERSNHLTIVHVLEDDAEAATIMFCPGGRGAPALTPGAKMLAPARRSSLPCTRSHDLRRPSARGHRRHAPHRREPRRPSL